MVKTDKYRIAVKFSFHMSSNLNCVFCTVPNVYVPITFCISKKLKNNQRYFKTNAYLNWFINKMITKFENRNYNNANNCNVDNMQEME